MPGISVCGTCLCLDGDSDSARAAGPSRDEKVPGPPPPGPHPPVAGPPPWGPTTAGTGTGTAAGLPRGRRMRRRGGGCCGAAGRRVRSLRPPRGTRVLAVAGGVGLRPRSAPRRPFPLSLFIARAPVPRPGHLIPVPGGRAGPAQLPGGRGCARREPRAQAGCMGQRWGSDGAGSGLGVREDWGGRAGLGLGAGRWPGAAKAAPGGGCAPPICKCLVEVFACRPSSPWGGTRRGVSRQSPA